MTQHPHTHEISVRFFDLDANNHVNNSVYFTYMEEARTKLLMEQYLHCRQHGVHFVVAEASCKYKRPIGLNDRVLVQLGIQNTSRISFDVAYQFTNGEGLTYAEGTTRMACIESSTGKLVRLPEAVLNFCQQVAV